MKRKQLFPLALLALSLTSCQIIDPVERLITSRSAVAFVVGGDAETTRISVSSVTEPVDLSLESGIAGLTLSEAVTSLDEAYFPEVKDMTKGTPIYTENFDAVYGGFSATAFDPKADGSLLTEVWGAGTYLENNGVVPFQKAEGKANTYYYDYNTGYTDSKVDWPESGSLIYFLQTPYDKTKGLNAKFYAPDGTSDHPMGSIQFDYTSPTSGNAGTDAEAQTDILFTSKIMDIDTKDSDNKVLFYHALTAIKFKDGTTGNNNGNDLVHIKKVTFNNIVGSGHCTISPSYDDKSQSRSSECTAWSDLGEADCCFTQTFTSKVNGYNSTLGKGYVPDSFSAYDTALNNLNDGTFTQTFMLIPQTCGDDATLTVEYTIGENSDVHSRTVSLKNMKWKAGELRTFTISINDVKVNVSDNMSGDKKTKYGILMENTGNVTAYLRCALVANWVYDDPNTTANENVIVSACDIFTTGKFCKTEEGDYGFKTNWLVGDDGYIYYTLPVKAQKPTKYRLFEMYQAPETTPYKDAHLEIAIALQGVQFDKEKTRVKAAWNVENVHVMELTFDSNGKMTQTPTGQTIADALIDVPEDIK